MINSTLTTINSYLQGFDKLYCLLERREKKTVEYSGGGSYSSIPFDNYAVGGYWRMRSAVTVSESEGTVACTKRQALTYPLYFVAWFNRDHVTETIDEFARNTMALISGLRTASVKTKVLGYDTEKQKEESGQVSNTWVMLRFNVDVVYTKNCPTTCVTPVIDDCILNGSINDVAIGDFFADFNITVENDLGVEVGEWDAENNVWVVPSGEGCTEITLTLPNGSFDFPVTDCEISTTVRQNDVEVEATFDESGNIIVPPATCDPFTLLINDVVVLVQIDPCGATTTLPCDYPVFGVVVSGAGELGVDGIYFANGDITNGEYKYYLNGDVNGNYIAFFNGEWSLFNSTGTRIYYTNPSTEPWTDAWVIEAGAGPAPTSEQATLADICPCPDGIAVLKDSDGHIISTTNIPSGQTVDLLAPDVRIFVNGNFEVGITSDEECDVQLTDQFANTIVPTSITPVGSDLAIVIDMPVCETLEELLAPITADDVIAEVWDNLSEAAQNEILDENCPVCPPADPVEISVAGTPVDDYAAGSSVNVTLVQAGGSVDVLAVTQPDASTIQVKTKWRCSQLVDHITLADNNPFGNTKRFTGLTGGYKVGASYFNAAGGGTTEALAFPNDIVIDWFTSKYDRVIGISRFINTPLGSNTNANQITALATLNSGAGYAGYTDWKRPNRLNFVLVPNELLAPSAMNFDPFNQTGYVGTQQQTVYCEEAYTPTPANQWNVSVQAAGLAQAANTFIRGGHIERIYTFAQLGL
jgi:hypothetical protein